MSPGVDSSRVGKAAAITLALVLLVPVASVLEGLGRGVPAQDDGTGGGGRGIVAREVLGAGDPFEVLARLEEAAGTGSSEVPMWFSDEIGIPPASRDVRVDLSSGVVGCVVDGKSEEVLAAIGERMTVAGWSMVPLGGVEGATFVKEEGECRWVMVSCTQVSSSTSVVFRCGSKISP